IEASVTYQGPPDQHMVVFVRNITARKRDEEERERLQAQLVQAQKMEAVGQLAGGIAHDFNNILAAMIMQLDVLTLRRNAPAEELSQGLEQLSKSANRAANLTRQLLLFGRRHAMNRVRVDLNTIVTEFGRLLGRLLGEQITLDIDLHEEPLWIDADAGMIEQVVT